MEGGGGVDEERTKAAQVDGDQPTGEDAERNEKKRRENAYFVMIYARLSLHEAHLYIISSENFQFSLNSKLSKKYFIFYLIIILEFIVFWLISKYNKAWLLKELI